MKVQTIEFSIVVVANDCNPTILNPDFLQMREIVPAKWKWVVTGPSITTPPYAAVNYDSGISVSVETNKFQVVDKMKDRQIDLDILEHIATQYIVVLPHVRYTAVGNNMKAFVQIEDPESFLKGRFLKEGVWDNETQRLQSSNYKFTYEMEDGLRSYTFESAKYVDTSGDEPRQTDGLLIGANYHRGCTGYPTSDQVINHIRNANADLKHFHDSLTEILES